MKLLKTFAILLVILVVFGASMFALNLYTGPIIEANNAGAANDRLNAVMPGGAAYEDITATLNDVPASVKEIHKETAGLGYVIICTAETQFSDSPMEIIIGVSADGKICGIKIDSYGAGSSNWNNKLDAANYPATYIGQDSALADVGLAAGVTVSSTAFKNAVSEAMSVLAANNMITAGTKSDAQILEELISTVAPGFTKLVESTASGNIQKALKAENDTGYAFVITSGDASYLAVVNATGACKVYDVEGKDVTADNAAVVTEAKAAAAAGQTSYVDPLTEKVSEMMEGAADFTALELDTFSTIAAAVSFTVEDATYYAFYSRINGWDSRMMDIYFVIDANGAIAKMDAEEFVFEVHDFEEYGGFEGMPSGYNDNFVGITGESWTGDAALIAGATFSTNAVKQATTDAFAAFNSIKGGEQ